MSECPAEILKTDAACYAFVLIDVFLIIVVNELMPERLTKNNPRNCDQKKRQIEDASSRVFLPGTGGSRRGLFPSVGAASRRLTMNMLRGTHTELSEGHTNSRPPPEAQTEDYKRNETQKGARVEEGRAIA